MHRLVPLVSVVLVVACASDASPPMQRWTGTMDTLPSGHVVVRTLDVAVRLEQSPKSRPVADSAIGCAIRNIVPDGVRRGSPGA